MPVPGQADRLRNHISVTASSSSMGQQVKAEGDGGLKRNSHLLQLERSAEKDKRNNILEDDDDLDALMAPTFWSAPPTSGSIQRLEPTTSDPKSPSPTRRRLKKTALKKRISDTSPREVRYCASSSSAGRRNSHNAARATAAILNKSSTSTSTYGRLREPSHRAEQARSSQSSGGAIAKHNREVPMHDQHFRD